MGRGWLKKTKYKRRNVEELPRWEQDFYLAAPKYSYLVEEYMEMGKISNERTNNNNILNHNICKTEVEFIFGYEYYL